MANRLFYKLNNYIYTPAIVAGVIRFKDTGAFPPRVSKAKYELKWHDFEVRDHKLFYHVDPLSLEVVPTDKIQDVLCAEYADETMGVGVGCTAFYQKLCEIRGYTS